MMFSFPYVVLLLFMGICAYLFEHTESEEKRGYVSLTAMAAFLVFYGFRGYIYSDWILYTETFRNVEWGDLLRYDITDKEFHEPGFTLLCLLCKSLVNEYVFLNVTCTTIFLALLYRFCRQFGFDNIALVLVMVIAMDGTEMVVNLLRNSISIVIWLNALIYVKERRPLPYFALCTLALSFHLSSLLFYPLYFVLHRQVNRWVFLGLFVFFLGFFLSKASILLSIIQLFGFEGVLGAKAEAYTEVYVVSRGLNPSGTLEKVALVILLFIYYDEVVARCKGGYIFINCLLLYFFAYYFCGEFKTMSDRMSMLFIFARWLLWIEMIRILVIENNRKLLAGTIFLYCVYMTSLNLNEPVMEYDNVLTGAKTEAERRRMFFKIFEEEK